MRLRDILAKEMNKSGGSAKLVKVPDNRRPTTASLQKLDQEIISQIKTKNSTQIKN